MAKTTTSSSKSAKTKTTKKAVPVKAAKATKSTKTTTKSKAVTKKVTKPVNTTKVEKPEVKVASVTKKPTILSYAKLRSIHLLSAGAFLVMAVLAGIFMKASSYQLSLPHITRDALNGDMVSASHVVMDIEARYMVITMLVLSAAFSLWRYRNTVRDAAAVGRRIVPVRWIDFAITGALMVQTVALLSGVEDLIALKFLGFLVVASAVYSWIAERENAGAARAVRGAYEASAASAVLVLLGLAAAAIATPLFGMVSAEWFVYVLYAIVLLGATRLARIQYREYRHKDGRTENYLTVERSYLTVNLLTKVAFAAVLVGGLLK